MARPKGAHGKNKAYLEHRLKAMYGDDFDPILRMAEQATRLHAAAIDAEDTRPLVESVAAWDKIAQYVQPKLKAIEVTGENGEAIELKHKGLTVEIIRAKHSDT